MPGEDGGDSVLPPPGSETTGQGIESFLRGEIARLLRSPESGIDWDKSLAELGLNSLQTVALKHAADAAFGIDMPLPLLLSDIGSAGLAAAIANLPPSATASSPPAPAEIGDSQGALLSETQRAIAMVHHLDETRVSHNLHLAIELTGVLDAGRLQASLAVLCNRHEQLRTRFSLTGDAVQPAVASLEGLPPIMRTVDASDLNAAELQTELGKEARRPFDLTKEPPLRAVLFRLSPERHLLFFCAHHIAIDFWSLLLLIRELDAAYGALRAGEKPELPQAACHADFVIRETAYLASPAASRDFAYWSEVLADLPSPLVLPTDFPRPTAPDHRGASEVLRLDPALSEGLRVLAAQEKVSLFTLLLAVWQVLLHRHTGQRDIIVGSPSSGRLQARFAGLVANCINPIALRGQLDPSEHFLGVLRQLRARVQSGLAHQEFPFPVLVERLRPERHGDHWPIYQTWFVLQQVPADFPRSLSALALGEDGEPFSLCGCAATPLALRDRVENFDIKLMAAETGQGLVFSFQYRTALFRPSTIARMAGHFRTLIEGILRSPECPVGELPLLTSNEMRKITRWNETAQDWPEDGFLPQLIENRVAAKGQAPALLFGDEQLSYAELNLRANRVAHNLIGRGVGTDDIIAICARRSFELVIGLLAIIKAGAAYLPLDPDDPTERIAALCSDAAPKCFLVQHGLERELPVADVPVLRLDAAASLFAGQPNHNPVRSIKAAQLAYVIFTSGSTGRPKGVGIPHAGLRNRLLWMQRHFPIGSQDTLLQKTSYTFDVSVWEFFWPLLAGARLVLAGPLDHRDPRQLTALISRHGVTVLHFVPSLLRVFLETAELDGAKSLRHVICSGEALTGDLVQRFKELLPARLHNLYGPTEATIDVSAAECDDPAAVSIGWPIANVSLHVLDARLQPLPVGVMGELCIGGVQLARGYIGRAGLTASAFIPNPFGPPGSRLYRTGDLVRRRAVGSIDYIGRIDHQLKIRGFRIEPAEIEVCLLRHSDVSAAAVLALDGGSGERRLVAWLQCRQSERGKAEMAEMLRAHLRESLPDYMVPAALVFLNSLPLNASGKLDRKKLPAPDFAAQLTSRHVAPRNETEAILARIWEKVLQLEQVGVEDNFFVLGGDSVRGIVMASRAGEAGLRLSPAALFQYPTIAELARVAEPMEPAALGARLVAAAPPSRRGRLRPEDFPLASLTQEELEFLARGSRRRPGHLSPCADAGGHPFS